MILSVMPPTCSKFITQLEKLKAYDKSTLLLRLYVQKLATFPFVAVEVVYRIVESASIFHCVPDIMSHLYLYWHYCKDKFVV
jgi:hypothetical protein